MCYLLCNQLLVIKLLKVVIIVLQESATKAQAELQTRKDEVRTTYSFCFRHNCRFFIECFLETHFLVMFSF